MYRSSKVRIVVRRWGVGLPPFQCAKGFPPIQYQFWAVIHKALKKTSLSHRVYGTHSFHFGEASKAVSFGVSSFNLKWLSLWGSKIYHSWDITSRYLWDIKVTSIGWTVWIAQWGTSQGWGGGILQALRLNGHGWRLCPFMPSMYSSAGWVREDSEYIPD